MEKLTYAGYTCHQTILKSKLAKSHSKTKTTAAILVSALLSLGSSQSVFASASTIGKGNLVTGENGVTDGYSNTVTAIKGSAQGNDSIATGNNLTRDEFSAKLNEYNGLVHDKTTKEGELSTLDTNLAVNKQAQDDLAKQISDLDSIINRASNKGNQIDNLNNQLNQKNTDFAALQDALRNAKEQAATTSASGSGNKTIWTDFTAQLGKLNWGKLADSSNGTSGVNKLATDLKGLIEADYPDYTNRWDIDKYEEVINGYVNRQGLFDANQDNAGRELYRNILGTKSSYAYGLGDYFNYHSTVNKRAAHEGSYNIVNYLEKRYSVSSSDFDINSIMDYNIDIYFTKKLDKDITPYFSYYNLTEIVNDSNENNIKRLSNGYNLTSLNYHHNKAVDASKVNYEHVKSLLELPPIKEGEKAGIEFIYQNNLSHFITNTFRNELASVDNGIISDQNVKAFISNSDVDYLRNWVDLFYNNFYNKVDLESNDENWLFDKDNFIAQFTKVEEFAHKLKDYVAAYDAAIASPSDTNAQIRLVTLYNEIREQKGNPQNYYENIRVQLKQSTLDIWNQQVEKSAEKLTEYAKKLKLYDARNEVIQGVITAAQELKNNIDVAQKAIDLKQKEIDDINKQIADLALTPDEKGASDLKRQKEQELANKQAEKAQIEQDKTAKQAELDEIHRKFTETQLANLGKNSLAIGTNAFASGNNSIAMGTNATVTANDGIIIGRDSTVTGVSSMAIGASNTVQSANAIAFGNNITIGTGFDGAVVLGDSSTVAAANPTASMEIRGETYNFAGTTPTSTVSIGAEGKERQIVNVAAGRISNTSTDAINGSQLYALADAVNKLETGAVDPDDVSDAIQNALTNNLKAGNNVTIDEEVNPDTNQKTFTIHATQPTISAGDNITVNKDGNNITINAVPFDVQAGTGVTVNKDGNTFTVNAKQPDIQAGTGVTIDKQGDTLTINAQGKDYRAGDNVVIKDVEGQTFISANSTTVSSGAGITVTTTTTTTANGATNTNYEVALAESLKAQIAKEESVIGKGNIIVTQDGANETGGKNFVVKLANDVDLGDKGSLKLGDIEIAGGNINMGGNQIQGVAKGKKPTDAVNVEQLNEAKSTITAGDKVNVLVSKNADGSTNYTVNAKTSEVKGGTNAQVVETTGDNGQSVYTVNVKGDLTNINAIQGDSGTKITLGDTIDVGGARISNVGAPVKPTDAVNKAYVDKGIHSQTDDGKVTHYKLGDTIAVTGDGKNLSTATTNGKVQVKLADDVKVNSVSTGDVSISKKGVNAGGKKVTNVAPATLSPTSTEAVNGSQLYATNLKVNQNTQHIAKFGDRINHLDNKLNQVSKDLRAGVAGAAAIAGLPQVRGHGKSMFAASAGNYKGQSAIAVGYTKASDNGKLLLKLSGSANTQGDFISRLLFYAYFAT